MKHIMNRIRKVAASLLVMSCIGAGPALANNITVQNVQLVNRNAAAQTIDVQFDISWENSWRVSTGPANWDAAWVFLKFRRADGVWRHGSLSTTNTDHTVPAGASVQVGLTNTTGMGAFLYRSTNGSGNIAWSGVKLKWLYGANGVTDTSLVSVDVSAIEMVYIPQGAFYVGDGSSPNRFGDGATLQPFQITTDGNIACVPAAGQLWAQNQGATGFTYSGLWPSGFNAFYAMKYEVTQGQYADAVNKGVQLQQYSGGGTYQISRQSLSGQVGTFSSSFPHKAFIAAHTDFVSFSSGGGWPTEHRYRYYPEIFDANSGRFSLVASYLDWSGLRPMSELEHEKACRGALAPVAGEFAWGTVYRHLTGYEFTNDGAQNEAISVSSYNTTEGNAIIHTRLGTQSSHPSGIPYRVGIFALSSYASTTAPRIQSGGSYYGLMDMTGNAQEPVLSFTGGNSPSGAIPFGDGDGVAPNWPGFRARGFPTGTSMPTVSERFDTAFADNRGLVTTSTAPSANDINLFVGIRGVREAP